MAANGSDLFSINEIMHENGSIRAELSINADSEILKGHFPGHPVVPGASMLQLVKDVLEQALNTRLRLKKADHLKFITLIGPGAVDVQLEINYKVTEDGFFVTSKLSAGGAVCFKLQGVFVETQS
jgi:3-hydroxyacyl-[acyl-carrier-protein] dehydratase